MRLDNCSIPCKAGIIFTLIRTFAEKQKRKDLQCPMFVLDSKRYTHQGSRPQAAKKRRFQGEHSVGQSSAVSAHIFRYSY